MRPETLIEKYRSIRTSYDKGNLSEAEFSAACDELVTSDKDGRWWSVDRTGALLVFDDASGQWTPYTSGKKTPTSRGGAKAKTTRGHGKSSGGRKPTASGQQADAASREAVPPLPSLEAVGPSLGIVFAASLILSWIGWDLLKIVPVMINNVIPTGSCTSFSAGSIGMYFCSAFVGLRVVFGSLVLAVALLVLRKPISALINRINAAVPEKHRSVMPAIVAALFFAVVWAGSHDATGDLWGILPHRAFPALVGMFVHLTMTYGPGFIARNKRFFDARDRLSMFMRWGMVFLLPTAVSLVITLQERVSNEAFKQQFVVLVGMLGAFIIMTPRSGKLADMSLPTRSVGKGR